MGNDTNTVTIEPVACFISFILFHFVKNADIYIYMNYDINEAPMKPDYNFNPEPAALEQGVTAVGQHKKINKNIVIVTAFSALGGALFGYDTGIISGVKSFNSFKDFFNDPNDVMISLIVSAVIVGAIVGCLIVTPFTDKYGRRPGLMFSAIVFTIGAGLMGGAVDVGMLIVGRFVAGVGVGSASLLVPMYVAELSPASVRGALVSVNEVFVTGGIMIAYAVNIAFENVPHGWAYSLGLSGVPSAILLVGMFFLPETPQWLLMQDREEDARKVLQHIRGDAPIDLEIDAIKQDVDTARQQKSVSWNELMRPDVFKVMMIGFGVTMFQQFVGINAIMYYAPEIFSSSGMKNSELIATLIVGAVNCIGSVVSLFIVDRAGRKTLLLWGSIFMSISMAGVTVVSGVDKYDEVSVLGPITIVIICLFIGSFSISWGSVAWLIPSEIFPLRLRAKMIMVSTIGLWIGNLIISMIFLPIYNAIGWGVFLIFVGIIVASLIFTYLWVPETKGKTLEEITRELGL